MKTYKQKLIEHLRTKMIYRLQEAEEPLTREEEQFDRQSKIMDDQGLTGAEFVGGSGSNPGIAVRPDGKTAVDPTQQTALDKFLASRASARRAIGMPPTTGNEVPGPTPASRAAMAGALETIRGVQPSTAPAITPNQSRSVTPAATQPPTSAQPPVSSPPPKRGVPSGSGGGDLDEPSTTPAPTPNQGRGSGRGGPSGRIGHGSGSENFNEPSTAPAATTTQRQPPKPVPPPPKRGVPSGSGGGDLDEPSTAPAPTPNQSRSVTPAATTTQRQPPKPVPRPPKRGVPSGSGGGDHFEENVNMKTYKQKLTEQLRTKIIYRLQEAKIGDIDLGPSSLSALDTMGILTGSERGLPGGIERARTGPLANIYNDNNLVKAWRNGANYLLRTMTKDDPNWAHRVREAIHNVARRATEHPNYESHRYPLLPEDHPLFGMTREEVIQDHTENIRIHNQLLNVVRTKSKSGNHTDTDLENIIRLEKNKKLYELGIQYAMGTRPHVDEVDMAKMPPDPDDPHDQYGQLT